VKLGPERRGSGMGDYKLDVEMAVSGDRDARDRLKILEKYIEQTRARAAALNRLKISPAMAVDNRISAPLRSVRAELERAGSLYTRVFRNAGAGVGESIKPVLYSISDWFDFCRSKVDWWKNSLIRAGRVAAERVLSEFQRAYEKIRKMFLDKLNFNLNTSGKLLIEHKVIAFVNMLGGGDKAPAGEHPSKAANKSSNKAHDTIKEGFSVFGKIWTGFSEGIDAADKMGNTDIRQKIKNSRVGQALTKAAKAVGDVKIGQRTLRQIGAGTINRAVKGVSNVARTVGEVKVGKNTLGDIGSGVADFGKKAFRGASKVSRNLPFVGRLIDLANIAIADDKEKAIAQTAGATVGAWTGAKAGALFGSVALPGVGTVAGGILGGIIGSFAGDWLAGKAVDKARSNLPASLTYDTEAAPPAAAPRTGSDRGQIMVAQNFTLNVSVDGNLDRADLARFIAEKISAEVQKIMQNTTPNPAIAGGGV
jgi:hypothetical protein